MKTIRWKKRNGTEAIHCIYSKVEADRLEMKYLPDWREGDTGDWVLTDDDHVVQIIRTYRDKSNRKLVHTCTMTTNAGGKACKLDVVERQSRYSINGKSVNLKPKHLTAKIASMCSFVIAGMRPEQAFILSHYGTEASDKAVTKYVKERARTLMASEVVKQEIKRTLGDRLERNGMSVEWLLRQYRALIEGGENESAKVSALNKISQFHGLDGAMQEAPPLPQISEKAMEKLAQLGKEADSEPTVAVSEVISDQEISEASVEPKDDSHEEDDDIVFTGTSGLYSGPSDRTNPKS